MQSDRAGDSDFGLFQQTGIRGQACHEHHMILSALYGRFIPKMSADFFIIKYQYVMLQCLRKNP